MFCSVRKFSSSLRRGMFCDEESSKVSLRMSSSRMNQTLFGILIFTGM